MKRMEYKSTKTIIESYDKGYRITKEGQVLSPYNKILKFYITNDGYKQFSIKSSEYGRSTIKFYQLQAYQKFGLNMFEDNICVRHLNGNSLDDSYDNIALGTQSDNMMDKSKEVRVSTAIHASKKKRKFTDEQVESILKDRSEGFTYKDLCEKYDTSKSTLSYLFNYSYYANKCK